MHVTHAMNPNMFECRGEGGRRGRTGGGWDLSEAVQKRAVEIRAPLQSLAGVAAFVLFAEAIGAIPPSDRLRPTPPSAADAGDICLGAVQLSPRLRNNPRRVFSWVS